jgi:hypothetical protein
MRSIDFGTHNCLVTFTCWEDPGHSLTLQHNPTESCIMPCLNSMAFPRILVEYASQCSVKLARIQAGQEAREWRPIWPGQCPSQNKGCQRAHTEEQDLTQHLQTLANWTRVHDSATRWNLRITRTQTARWIGQRRQDTPATKLNQRPQFWKENRFKISRRNPNSKTATWKQENQIETDYCSKRQLLQSHQQTKVSFKETELNNSISKGQLALNFWALRALRIQPLDLDMVL